MVINAFNVRVYGVLKNHDNKVLVIKEGYAGERLVKLPGGGLEFGEGVIDCLVREFKEELNLEVKIIKHLYTQDFYLASKFKPNEQLLTIYYLVTSENLNDLEKLDKDIDEILWVDEANLLNYLVLPVDRVVADIILSE